MNDIDYEKYQVAEAVTTPYLVNLAEENYKQSIRGMLEETNARAKNGEHPFKQLEQFNTCEWISIASIECFTAIVAGQRFQRMPYQDVERDINFNLIRVWELATNLIGSKVFFTAEVSFDHELALWNVAIMLNVTDGTGLTIEDLDIKLLHVITSTKVTRHY